MQLIDIIKETLNSLRENNIVATPKNYAKTFNSLVETLDEPIEDILEFKNKLKKLTRSELKTVDSKKINTHIELVDILMERISETDLKKLVNAFRDIMTPSVNYEIEDEIDEVLANLFLYPKDLVKNETIAKLRELSKKRVDLDRLALREKTDDIHKLTNLIGKYFDKSLKSSNDVGKDLLHIKDELESLNISNFSQREMTIFKSKIIENIYSMENSIQEYEENMKDTKSEIDSLNKKISELQAHLVEIKEENLIDHLTSIKNRRGFEIEVKKIEEEHKIFNLNYAIVYYDIDMFKNVNDKYGHDCGDSVLVTFSKILKKLTRGDDIIARYGGEEFVALIHYNEEKELVKYLTRVKSLIKKSKFIYNDISIKLTFSAGVSFRNRYKNYEDALKKSDSLLYKAKHAGRDKIIIEENIEL